jgi:hypothetical protein
MDGLSVVVAIGALVVALMVYLEAADYMDPVSDPSAGGFSAGQMSMRHR